MHKFLTKIKICWAILMAKRGFVICINDDNLQKCEDNMEFNTKLSFWSLSEYYCRNIMRKIGLSSDKEDLLILKALEGKDEN